MKSLLLLIVLGLLNSIACSEKQVQSATEIKGDSSPVLSDSPILEVITNVYGGYPKDGDILQMRLFKDGRFEYDDFPDYDPPRATGRNVTITKKEARLTEDDVKELIALATSPNFLSSKEKYESMRGRLDDWYITKISFQRGSIRKAITAVNFWDTQYSPEFKKNYPSSLVQLLEQVEQMKAKATGRQSYQWLAKPGTIK